MLRFTLKWKKIELGTFDKTTNNKFQRFFIQKIELNQITWVLFNQFAYTKSKINKGKHYLHTK